MFIVENGKIKGSKVLDLGKLRSIDLAFTFDLAFEDADKFQLSIAETTNALYGFTNSGKLSFAKVDFDFIGKEETEVAVSIKHNGIEILTDSINVLAVIQGGGQIVLPEVTVTADKMLKDITAINTDGAVVTGNIENAVVTTDETDGLTVNISKGYVSADVAESFSASTITTDETDGLTVNISKGYVSADVAESFDSSTVTETDTEVTVSRGWLKADQTFSVGGSSDVQGIIYNAFPVSACTQVKIIPPELTKDTTSFSKMFSDCKALTSVPNFDTSNGTNFSNMFNYCEALTSIPALDTSNGTNFSNMFNYCYSLASVPALDTSNGTNFSYMFNYCEALTSIPALDTSNGTTFSGMFQSCKVLTSVPALNTSNGTTFNGMFNICEALTSVPALDTSNGTNFSNMFQSCKVLTSVPALDTSNGTNFYNMFNGCKVLTSVPALDTSNGTNFSGMFNNCATLTSIPALDTSNGTNFDFMFTYCAALTTIQGINFSSVTSAISSNIFYGCSALKNVTFNGTLSQSIDISQAPNLNHQSLQSLVDACTAVSSPKYITATGNALSILNSYFKTELTNKNWGIKEG